MEKTTNRTSTDKKQAAESAPIPIFDRLFAALLSATITAATAILAPVIALCILRGRPVDILLAYTNFSIWMPILASIAGITGFTLGSERTITLYSHLWGTAQPKKTGLTLALWIGIIGIALGSCWLGWLHQG